MSNWLAITWEDDRIRLLSSRVHHGTVTFDHAAVLKVPQKVELGQIPDSVQSEFDDFIRKAKLAKAEVVVLMSRSEVEVRPMVFPPVPIEELPELVRFQAGKEFNAYDPHSPLDFAVTNKLEDVSRSTLFPVVNEASLRKISDKSPQTAPRHVLASTIRQEQFLKIQRFAEQSGLTLRHIGLKPCESVFLLRQSPQFLQEKAVLLLELDHRETSQTVLYHGEPVFMRAPKIASPEDIENDDFAARLIAELKRTRIAVRNEIQGVTVDEVILCGAGPSMNRLAEKLARGLEVEVKTFDPWAGLNLSNQLKKRCEDEPFRAPERFAALIGALLRAGKSIPNDIDFCNPKKRPEPAGYRQLITASLALGFILLVLFLGYGYFNRTSLEREIKTLSATKLELEKTAKITATRRTQLTAIEDWLADHVNWFEQLAWLSRKAPPAQEMILNELVLNANKRGSMTLKAMLRDSSVVQPMENSLHDEKHDVQTGEKGEVKGNSQYHFRFNLSVYLSSSSSASSRASNSNEGQQTLPSEPEQVIEPPEPPESTEP